MSHPITAPAAGGVEQAGVLGWYKELSGRERRTFWACFTGWSLDAMDANLYSFAIPALIAVWGITRGDAGVLGTAALLSSALGGWVAGIVSDRIGRVRTLQITILWFAGFTALSAVTQSFNQLLAVRALQGLGFGGEWAAGAVLIGEIIRDRHRGKGGGMVHSGWAIGWGLAAIVSTLCFNLLPQDVAWRVMFAIGVLPAGFVFFLRQSVEETPAFRQHAGPRLPLGAIFGRDVLKVTVLASVLSMGTQGGYYAIMIWLPTYLQSVRHLNVLNTGGYLSVVIVASFVGYTAGAYLTDALGRRPAFILFSVGSLATVIAYTFFSLGDASMLVLGAPLGFFASGTYSGIVALLNELYPTAMRGSGVGFCFNFGRATGALFPALVGYLSASMPLGQAIGIFTTGAYCLIVIAASILPETRGRSLLT